MQICAKRPSKGSFRDDLYHRLDSIQLRVPSLRERVDDILPLCEFFLSSSGCFLNGDALELLRSYSWPGNVRELRNVLNKAVVFAGRRRTHPAGPAGRAKKRAEDPSRVIRSKNWKRKRFGGHLSTPAAISKKPRIFWESLAGP